MWWIMKKNKLFNLSILDDVYYKVDNDGKILEVSPSIKRVLGYDENEVIGLDIKSLYINFNERDENLKNRDKASTSFSFESFMRHKDGKHVLMSANSHFIKDNSGNIVGIEGIARDITLKNELHDKLIQNKQKYKVIFENSPSGIIYFNTKGIIIEANQSALSIFGVSRDKFIGFDLMFSLKDKKLIKVIKQSLSSGQAYYKDIYFSLFSQKDIYLEIFFRAIRDEKDKIKFIVASLDDKSSEYKAIKNLEKSKEEWKSIIDNMLNIFVQTNKDGIIQKASPSVKELIGYEVDELIGKNIILLWKDTKERVGYREEYLKNLKPIKNKEAYIKAKDGKTILINANIAPRFDDDKNYIGSDNFIEDITEFKKSEDKIKYIATHDNLTSLPNRFMLSNILEHTIDIAKRTKNSIAVLFLDLDDFKNINDNFGHYEGDKVLIEVAKRLKKMLCKDDFICRFGGDEFVILLEHIKCNKDVADIVKKLNKIFLKVFKTQIYTHHLSCSIGIALYPDDALSPEQLLKFADTAMYDAKKRGKNRYSFYLKELGKQIEKELHIERLLRDAIKNDELELFYQPQILLQNEKIVGLEALLRWNNPELGFVGPNSFIPIAEKTHMIVEIGNWVLHSACKQTKKWHDLGLYKGDVSVNISGIQLNTDNLVSALQSSLKYSGLDPIFLDLEITESVLMDNSKNWITLLDKIKDMGIDISIDDFGTGYSSLSHLKQFPADELKIDKSFIDDIPHKKDACIIVKTIISLAKNLGYKSVAEGVETLEQKEYLKEQGCDIVQGFYYSKPLSVVDLEECFLNQNLNKKGILC